jgi:FAD/FMN-containing dehydrogenase
VPRLGGGAYEIRSDMTYVLRNDALSWGRVIRTPQWVASPRFQKDLNALIAEHPGAAILPVGLQRSYGDSVLNSDGGLISMVGLDRFIAFDLAAGQIRAEAGVTLSDILKLVVPHGFFLPVTPGTRFVTLGGAIANDVHGKNHHSAGTIGRHVTRIGLLRSDGSRLEIGPDRNNDLFAATIGGIGLTGIIEWAELTLVPIKSSQLDVQIVPYSDLSEFWELAAKSNEKHEHTVAWIDSTSEGRGFGRGIFSRANWSNEGGLVVHFDRQRLAVPIDAPNKLLNGVTINLFNRLYYCAQKHKAGEQRVHYAPFFYPLDSIADWNRLYGRRGFWQYQCVMPRHSMKDGIKEIMNEIVRSDQGAFLGILKTCGNLLSPGLLSFPMEGATLALDFPNRGELTLKFFTRLDAIVRSAHGRLYAAKDGRIPKEMWLAGYPNLDRFVPHIDPGVASDFWRRVAP